MAKGLYLKIETLQTLVKLIVLYLLQNKYTITSSPFTYPDDWLLIINMENLYAYSPVVTTPKVLLEEDS